VKVSNHAILGHFNTSLENASPPKKAQQQHKPSSSVCHHHHYSWRVSRKALLSPSSVPASPNQTKYTPHLHISPEHKTQPYTRPQIGKGVVVAECSGMRCNEILRVKHVKMHWRKNKSASVTKKNKGIEGTRAQSTKQGSDSEQEIHGKGKNDLLVVKGKHDLEK
jgi:hypothetical protein